MMAASIGGAVSELTGGKFSNGAVSAAFTHLFNNEGVGSIKTGTKPLPQGGRETLEEIKNGSISVFSGATRAVRFLGRGLGLYGADERQNWELEDALTAEFTSRYYNDAEFRGQVNIEAEQYWNEVELNETYLVSRSVTGLVLAPMGALGVIGDMTYAVELQVKAGREVVPSEVIDSIINGGL